MLRKKAIQGVNDIATTDPELIAEWDFDKNEPLVCFKDILF